MLEDTDKYIEVVDGRHGKSKREIQIKLCDDNEDIFIATLNNVLLSLDICDRLFPIITLIHSGHRCLFHKGFCTMYFSDKEKMRLIYHIVHKKKHAFRGGNKENIEIKEDST